ncbi:hypothetical protein [Peribacillus sp. SCS-155]|uniref:hypothetical protein n=1 Tax=Peribacillus sedimenti TaxID=3115297 RepID=UPI0039058989
MFHKAQIQELIEKADFQIFKQVIVDATYLQDAKWEKSYANSIRKEFAGAPAMIQTLVSSYYELMNASSHQEQSLNSFVLCAR